MEHERRGGSIHLHLTQGHVVLLNINYSTYVWVEVKLCGTEKFIPRENLPKQLAQSNFQFIFNKVMKSGMESTFNFLNLQGFIYSFIF